MKLAIFLFAFFACTYTSADPLYSLSLIPSDGTIAGIPGAVTGWGFTLTDSDPSNWIVLNDSNFTGSTVNGTYVDYIVNQFYVAGPAPEKSTITVPWDSTTQNGVAEFDISPTASPGPIPGNIVVDYSIFSQDPNSGNFDPSSFVTAGSFTASAQVNVTPEPASGGLFVAALALIMWRNLRSMCTRSQR